MQPVRWLSMYPIRSKLANLGVLAGGLDDRDALVAEHQVPEFVSEGAVPGGQTLLDQEDIAVGVLAPLPAHPGRQIGHLEFDRPFAILADGVDETRQGHFPASWGEIEHVTDGAGDATAGRHTTPFRRNPLCAVHPGRAGSLSVHKPCGAACVYRVARLCLAISNQSAGAGEYKHARNSGHCQGRDLGQPGVPQIIRVADPV